MKKRIFDFTSVNSLLELEKEHSKYITEPENTIFIVDKYLIESISILMFDGFEPIVPNYFTFNGTTLMTMHQYNTWPGLNCGDSECSDCTDCSCATVDRDKYPHDCICGSACYISPMPGFSECLGCDEPKEKK
jgi:hypothetical protein